MEGDSASGKSTTTGKEKVLIKIIVLGCANVGKTSIMERFVIVNNFFIAQH